MNLTTKEPISRVVSKLTWGSHPLVLGPSSCLHATLPSESLLGYYCKGQPCFLVTLLNISSHKTMLCPPDSSHSQTLDKWF